jgi:hypothetical protein
MITKSNKIKIIISTYISETKKRLIKDNFTKNPIHIPSKEEMKNINILEQQKTSVKGQRVANYLSSEGVKSSVLSAKTESTSSNNITNIDVNRIKSILKNQEQKKYIKTFKHIVDNKKAYYY